MAGIDRKIPIHRSLDNVEFFTGEPLDSAAPGDSVMHNEKFRSGLYCGTNTFNACIDCKCNLLDIIPFAPYLHSIIGCVIKLPRLENSIKPPNRFFKTEIHKS